MSSAQDPKGAEGGIEALEASTDRITLASTLQFDVADAVAALEGYRRFRRTVEIYDLGGQDGEGPAPDRITLSDLGRLVVINADLAAGDVPRLLDASATVPWTEVPAEADLADADPAVHGGLYDAMIAMWDALDRVPNIGPAKASKLLHLKRPKAFPLLDAQVRSLYDEAAAEAATRYPHRGYTRMHWAAIRDDLVAGRSALAAVRRVLSEGSEWARMLAALSDLRLLDILAWSAVEGRRQRV